MPTTRAAPFALLALLLACAPPEGGGTGTAEDEQAIRSMSDRYAAAYSARDTAALGAMVADDYQAVDPTGRHIQGRDAATAAAAQELAMVPAGVSLSMKAGTTFVRWIDANHAVAGGTWEISPAMPGMPSKGSWVGTMVKQGGEWKMLSAMGAPDMTGMMPPPSPAPPSR